MLLDRLQLGSSGRPQLYRGECELHVSLEGARLEFVVPGGVRELCAESYANGELRLTTHRLLFCDRDGAYAGRRSCALPLYAVKSYELGGNTTSSGAPGDNDEDGKMRCACTHAHAALSLSLSLSLARARAYALNHS